MLFDDPLTNSARGVLDSGRRYRPEAFASPIQRKGRALRHGMRSGSNAYLNSGRVGSSSIETVRGAIAPWADGKCDIQPFTAR